MDCFITAKANSFENLLEPLQKLLRLSVPMASSLAQPEFFKRILQKLGSNKALTRLNLLRIVQSVCDASEEQGALINVYGLYETIQRLAESDGAILVRDMATKLTRSCDDHEVLTRSGGKRRAGPGSGMGSAGSGRRRTSTSTTPPGGLSGSSQSMPPTPTSSRSSHSKSYFGAGDRRSIVNGPVPFRTRGEEGLAGAELPNGGSGGAAAAKSRLPRTTLVRHSRQSILYGSPTREEAGSPTPQANRQEASVTPGQSLTPGQVAQAQIASPGGKQLASFAPAPISMAASRRRRQTSGGEGRWS